MPVGIYQTLTFSPHAHLQTLLKPTVLALVPVMLIDGTVPVPSTRVREISSYTSLEEALATCNKMDPIIYQALIATLGVSRTLCPRAPLFWEVVLRQKVNCSISFNTTKLPTDAGSYSSRTESTSDLYEGWNFNSGNYLFTTDTK